jgi:hypothetical protein
MRGRHSLKHSVYRKETTTNIVIARRNVHTVLILFGAFIDFPQLYAYLVQRPWRSCTIRALERETDMKTKIVSENYDILPRRSLGRVHRLGQEDAWIGRWH